jgi:hypothetical protein
VPSVAHQYLELAIGQQRVIHRHRVDSGRLHRHVRHAVAGQPPCTLAQHPIEGLECAFDRFASVGTVSTRRAHCHCNDVLADIDTGAPLIQDLHLVGSFFARCCNQQRALRCGASEHELKDWYSRSQQQPGGTRGWRLQRHSHLRPRTAKTTRRRHRSARTDSHPPPAGAPAPIKFSFLKETRVWQGAPLCDSCNATRYIGFVIQSFADKDTEKLFNRRRVKKYGPELSDRALQSC